MVIKPYLKPIYNYFELLFPHFPIGHQASASLTLAAIKQLHSLHCKIIGLNLSQLMQVASLSRATSLSAISQLILLPAFLNNRRA
jgi:hypothetical protein|tara:strand:- start:64 stop:318 length:255 start_codon:yes stop_codon:yes gene_type:complete